MQKPEGLHAGNGGLGKVGHAGLFEQKHRKRPQIDIYFCAPNELFPGPKGLGLCPRRGNCRSARRRRSPASLL